MKNMKDRILSIDIARVLCTIWIVGFWHFHGSWNGNFDFIRNSGIRYEVLTESVLACFTFISGYCLRKYKFCSLEDIKSFYKQRLLRFYVLFFVACLLMTIFQTIGQGSLLVQLKILLTTSLGISSFVPPTMSTLWYLSMLMMFYVLTPLFLFNYKLKIVRVLNSILFFVITFIIIKITDGDIRFLLYFPFYIIGLYSSEILYKIICSVKLGIISLILFIVALIQNFVTLSSVVEFISISWGVMSILFASSIIEAIVKGKNVIVNFLITYCSYSTMSVYLFHRFMYPLFIKVNGLVYPEGLSLIAVILSIIIMFVIGHFIQYLYDYLLRKNITICQN